MSRPPMAVAQELAPGRPQEHHEDARARPARPSLDDVWTALAVVIPTLLALVARLPTIDLAYHVRIGSLIGATRSIPATDPMSFAAEPGRWIDQQWGAQLLLSVVHDAGGFAALVVLRGACAAAIAGLVFATCRHRGASARLASLVTVATYVVAMPFLALRPQLFGAVAFVVVYLLVTARSRHPLLVWAVPAVTLVWVNVHGSFVLAVVVMTFALVDDLLRRRPTARPVAAALAATVVATVANPYGLAVWGYVVALGADDTIRSAVEEWRPPTPETAAGLVFLLAVLAVGGVLARRGRRLTWIELAWIGGFALLAFTAQRNVLWWALASAPLVAAMLASRPRAPSGGSRALNTAVIAALAAVSVAALPWVARPGPVVSGTPPATLVRATGRLLPPESRLLAYQPWASWLELTLPDAPMFVDSRIELFAPGTWDDYAVVIAGDPSAEDVLARWSVDAVLIPADREELRDVLAASPAWTLASESQGGLLFVRTSSTPGASGSGP